MEKIVQYQLKISPETFREVIEESIGEKVQDLILEDGEYFLEFEMKNTRFRVYLNQERDEISFGYFGESLEKFTRFKLVLIKIDGTRLIETFRLSGRFHRDRILKSIQAKVLEKLQERITLELKEIEL